MKKKQLRSEPKQTKTRSVSVCFVKPKKKFRFVSVFQTYIETFKTNRTVSKQTEATLNFQKNTKICSLSNCFGWSSVRFGSKKSKQRNSLFCCFGIEAKQPKETISKQTETTQNFLKKYKNMLSI
jgi:hypothetical protein